MASTEDPESEVLVDQPVRISLPNATAALVLGIISILTFCFFSGAVGVLLSIIALVLGGFAVREYKASPDMYTSNSYRNARVGRITGTIGLTLSLIVLIAAIAFYLIDDMIIVSVDSILQLLQDTLNDIF